MSRKPLIGINTDFFASDGRRPAYSVMCAGYYDCVQRAGGIPVLVPPLAEEDDLEAILDTVDGFLLIGGRDLAKDRTTTYSNSRIGGRIGGRLNVRGNDIFWGLGAMKIPYNGAPFFDIDERTDMLNTVFAEQDRILVRPFSGLVCTCTGLRRLLDTQQTPQTWHGLHKDLDL